MNNEKNLKEKTTEELVNELKALHTDHKQINTAIKIKVNKNKMMSLYKTR